MEHEAYLSLVLSDDKHGMATLVVVWSQYHQVPHLHLFGQQFVVLGLKRTLQRT
jgi:hypothetical protein